MTLPWPLLIVAALGISNVALTIFLMASGYEWKVEKPGKRLTVLPSCDACDELHKMHGPMMARKAREKGGAA